MPYAYNGYGYLDDLNKITEEDIKKYYDSVIKNDLVDVYVVGDVDEGKIKNIFRDYFKVTTYHKQEIDLITKELNDSKKMLEYKEQDDVNQTQLALLCNLKGLTDRERKYVMPVFTEMLGGTANSILFDAVREKNSYAYYVNAIVKSYDNVMMIYSGIEHGNSKNVMKIIKKTLGGIAKGKFDNDKFEGAKETMTSAIKASLDSPMGIITNYYAKTLVNSPDVDVRIKNINKVTRDDIIAVSKKVHIHTLFVLEGQDAKDNDK